MQAKAINTLESAKNFRDRHLGCFRTTLLILCALQIFMCFIMIVSGVSFAEHDILNPNRVHNNLSDEERDDDGYSFLRKAAMGTIVFSSLVLMTISGCGVYLSRNPANNCLTFAFGCFIFFFGFLPLFGSSTSLIAMRSVSRDELLDICDGGYLIMDKLGADDGENSAGRKFISAFTQLMDRIDTQTEHLVDQNMCTKTCPCYGEDTQHYNIFGQKVRGDYRNAYEVYNRNLTEAKLNEHKRTRTSTSPAYRLQGYEDMYFTHTRGLTFPNFAACYESWERKAEKDSSIDLAQVFSLDQVPLPDRVTRRRRGDKRGVQGFTYFARDLLNFEFLQEIEDSFQCSGMCKTGLFYFAANVTNGPPEETCLSKIKTVVDDASKSFAISSFFTSVVCFLVWILHFGLYCRRIEEPTESDVNMDHERGRMPSMHERPYDPDTPNYKPQVEMQNLDTEENAGEDQPAPPEADVDKQNQDVVEDPYLPPQPNAKVEF